jgi:superfamily II DNA or RNA helicase
MTGFNRWAELKDQEGYRGPPLRAWQERALLEWEANSKRGVIEAITGTGKSMVGVAAIHEVLSLGGVAAVIVPTKALVVQWSKTLRETLPGIRIGQLSDRKKDNFGAHDVVVTTIQSIYRAPLRTRSLMLLVADEVHRYGSEKYQAALTDDYSWRIALTGTYERQQDDGIEQYLKPFFGDVVFSYGYAEALREETVAPFELALVETPFNESESSAYKQADDRCTDARGKLIRQFGFPEDWREFFALVTKAAGSKEPNRIRDLSQQYMSGFAERKRILASTAAKLSFAEKIAPLLKDFRGTLVFSESKDSARRLAYVINKSVSAFPLDSDSKSAERDSRLREFSSGGLKVICAPRILDEGIDVPEAELAIIASASQTKRQMIQRMGRVIRLKAGGGSARIIILFVPKTPEDPDTGGYEAFLDEVIPHARSSIRVEEGNSSLLQAWLRDPEA